MSKRKSKRLFLRRMNGISLERGDEYEAWDEIDFTREATSPIFPLR